MIGRLLSGRYRIEAVVGTGGMAVVYRALDTQTGQTVAIKVLRPEYESDMEFVRRFSREAEAAAKMTHENIVNLLDVGIDEGGGLSDSPDAEDGQPPADPEAQRDSNLLRYIVMEYVDGRTLKEMIREEGRIHPDVALRMTIRILAAVDHAHRNGIVHRDIKPQNILVDMDGQVKVADFGIARLKAEQGAPNEDGGDEGADGEGGRSALGSVHYLSPEQARGEVVDEQSDLYSVGVVLYEMLTGHVPFDGDTSVSVALKHVSEAPRSMRVHNPHISKALDEVVMRALCKDKQRRYQTAAEMAADLRKTITHPRGGFVRYPDPEGTENEEKPKRRPRREPTGENSGESKPRRTLRTVLIVCGAAAACILLALGLYLRDLHNSVVMPNLIGHSQAEAVAGMEELGVDATVVNAYSEDFADGVVMLQSREPGDRLRRDAQITLTVSLGSQWYMLEDMTGWSVEDAVAALDAAKVASYTVNYAQSEQPVGSVISVDHEPGWMSRDVPVALKVSGQSVSVPSLTGLDLDGARAVIEAEGLTLGEVTEGESADAQSGAVIAQSIAPYSQVLAGSKVDLTLCVDQGVKYAPDTALTVVVPLNGLEVRVELIGPSGVPVDAFDDVLPSGTHQVLLESAEQGLHTVNIYMAGVLFESMQLNFA